MTIAFRSAFVSLILCGCITLMGCAHTEGSFAKLFGEENTVYRSEGGKVDDFLLAAEDVLKTGRHIKIDGVCASACATFADKARPNVCVTRNAVFKFHLAAWGTFIQTSSSHRVTFFETREPPPVSQDIEAWVAKHGGFPSKGFLLLTTEDALAFWPLCGNESTK